MGWVGYAVGVLYEVNHSAAGELQPDDMLAINGAGDFFDAKHIHPKAGGALFVYDVVGEVVDFG